MLCHTGISRLHLVTALILKVKGEKVQIKTNATFLGSHSFCQCLFHIMILQNEFTASCHRFDMFECKCEWARKSASCSFYFLSLSYFFTPLFNIRQKRDRKPEQSSGCHWMGPLSCSVSSEEKLHYGNAHFSVTCMLKHFLPFHIFIVFHFEYWAEICILTTSMIHRHGKWLHNPYLLSTILRSLSILCNSRLWLHYISEEINEHLLQNIYLITVITVNASIIITHCVHVNWTLYSVNILILIISTPQMSLSSLMKPCLIDCITE